MIHISLNNNIKLSFIQPLREVYLEIGEANMIYAYNLFESQNTSDR